MAGPTSNASDVYEMPRAAATWQVAWLRTRVGQATPWRAGWGMQVCACSLDACMGATTAMATVWTGLER